MERRGFLKLLGASAATLVVPTKSFVFFGSGSRLVRPPVEIDMARRLIRVNDTMSIQEMYRHIEEIYRDVPPMRDPMPVHGITPNLISVEPTFKVEESSLPKLTDGTILSSEWEIGGGRIVYSSHAHSPVRPTRIVLRCEGTI